MGKYSVRAGIFSHDSRSEEHTSELQSHLNLVCRLLLEKKKKKEENRRNIIQQENPRENKRDIIASIEAGTAEFVVNLHSQKGHSTVPHMARAWGLLCFS